MSNKFSRWMLALGLLALVATSAQANLLEEVTSEEAATAIAMSAVDLDQVRGEGNFEQFFEFPQLRRSFEKNFDFGQTSISIVGVSGVGITLTISTGN